MDALLCPRCATPMVPVPDVSGAWRCPSCGGEWLDDDPTEQTQQTEPDAVEAQTRSLAPTGTDGGGRLPGEPYVDHMQRTMGIFGPISHVPQSNVREGDGCLMTGSVAHGGGSKSGRRRKNPKGGKKFVDSPWEER